MGKTGSPGSWWVTHRASLSAHTEWGHNGVLTASPHLDTNTKWLKHSPLKNRAQTVCRSFLRNLLFATEPATSCSEPLLDNNSVFWEKLLSNSEEDTSGSSVHLAEHLMLSSDIQKQNLFRESRRSHSSHPESCPASLVMSLNTAPLITTTAKH